MTSKFSWEPLDRGSLLLRIKDGAKETSWTIRKTTTVVELYQTFRELADMLDDGLYPTTRAVKPLREPVRTVDDVELAEIREDAEKASRAAQQAKVDELSRKAQWWDDDEDEDDMFVANLPDYDSGEIK